jgi:hypothetical protein
VEGHVARLGEMRNNFKTDQNIFEARHNWEDDIKADLKEIGCGNVD